MIDVSRPVFLKRIDLANIFAFSPETMNKSRSFEALKVRRHNFKEDDLPGNS
jgi:hypothetical protein